MFGTLPGTQYWLSSRRRQIHLVCWPRYTAVWGFHPSPRGGFASGHAAFQPDKACSVSFARNLRMAPIRSSRGGLQQSVHSTTRGARTRTQSPETFACIPGACKDDE
jgi:hypothetical protein